MMNGFGLGGVAEGFNTSRTAATQEQQVLGNQGLRQQEIDLQVRQQQNAEKRQTIADSDKARVGLLSSIDSTIEALQQHGADPTTISEKIQPIVQTLKKLTQSSGLDPSSVDAQVAVRLAKPPVFSPEQFKTIQVEDPENPLVKKTFQFDPRIGGWKLMPPGTGGAGVPGRVTASGGPPASAPLPATQQPAGGMVPQREGDMPTPRIQQAFSAVSDAPTAPPAAVSAFQQAALPRAVSPAPVADSGPTAVGPDPVLLDTLAKRSGQTPESLDVNARALAGGNVSVLQNLGRGRQGGEAVKATRAWAAHVLIREQGLSPQEAAEAINAGVAEFAGHRAGAQSLGRREAMVIGAATTAMAVAPRVIEASKAVDRTQFPALNSIILAARQGTGDPNVVRFGIALNTMVNTYARAQGAGNSVVTDSARKEAWENLQKAWSAGQIEAAIDQMVNKELPSEITGAKMGMREFLNSRKTGRGGSGAGSTTATQPTIPPPPPGAVIFGQ